MFCNLKSELQIRRGIFETSSSSASAVAVAADGSKKKKVTLDKPFRLVLGQYDTSCDGRPHCYLTDWRAKMAYFAEDTPQWHEMFKGYTGQDFTVHKLWSETEYRRQRDEEWETIYMGDDGEHSMYIDLVKGEFGISSTDDRRWPVTSDIRDMFQTVRRERLKEKMSEE